MYEFGHARKIRKSIFWSWGSSLRHWIKSRCLHQNERNRKWNSYWTRFRRISLGKVQFSTFWSFKKKSSNFWKAIKGNSNRKPCWRSLYLWIWSFSFKSSPPFETTQSKHGTIRNHKIYGYWFTQKTNYTSFASINNKEILWLPKNIDPWTKQKKTKEKFLRFQWSRPYLSFHWTNWPFDFIVKVCANINFQLITKQQQFGHNNSVEHSGNPPVQLNPPPFDRPRRHNSARKPSVLPAAPKFTARGQEVLHSSKSSNNFQWNLHHSWIWSICEIFER